MAANNARSDAAAADVGWLSLLGASALAMLNEAAQPAGQLLVTLSIAHISTEPSLNTATLAAYAAVSSTFQFAEGIFTFLLVVVMARVGHAVGAGRWVEVGHHVTAALLSACLIGALCSTVLFFLRDYLMQLLHLDPQVQELAIEYYDLRLIACPLSMLSKCGVGVLLGYQRISFVAALSVVGSTIEGVGTGIVLFVYNLGLYGSGLATIANFSVQAALSLMGIICLPPAVAQRQIHLCCGRGGGSAQDSTDSRGGEESEEPPLKFSICGFLQDSGNMMIRSICLQISLYALSICASRNGAPSLAAHQVITQLWMLLSYVCDGYADVGTMKGSRLLGEGQFGAMRSMSYRLQIAGLVTGTAAAAVMMSAQDSIITVFAGRTSPSTVHALHQVWPLIAVLQPFNAMVFVYDGLLMATHSFAYVRNVFLIGVPCMYLPVLLYTNHRYHTLMAIWSAKACLNLWRFVTSVWHVNFNLAKQWHQAELHDLAQPLLTNHQQPVDEARDVATIA